jgi:hypothetical protein
MLRPNLSALETKRHTYPIQFAFQIIGKRFVAKMDCKAYKCVDSVSRQGARASNLRLGRDWLTLVGLE